MRSIIPIQARNALRSAVKSKYRAPYAAVRWSSSEARQWSTPLAKQLSEAISATGPIPLASFMRMCLTSDVGGYYTSKQDSRQQIGRDGDFVTSPEISQIFGDMIGIWFVTEWNAQGKKSKGVQFIEIGPGKGTLMNDILRAIQSWPQLASNIEAVYLVEASPSLRENQRQLLCGDAPMTETEVGHQSKCKYGDIPVIWTENIRFVPCGEDKTPFIVAHEFFDALPIHAFQSIAPSPYQESETIKTPTGELPLSPSAQKAKSNGPQWREMVVSPAPPTSTSTASKEPSLEFQLTLSKTSTPHSLYLPELSPRYRTLKSTPGSLIEISPESHAYAASIANLIGTPRSGAALILDYGPSGTIPINSLRGIKNHKIVSPLSEPGLVDLSADVDFTALAEAACKASEGIEVWGPVQQGDFLDNIGGRQWTGLLVKGKDGKDKERIEAGYRRLVDRGPSGMGKVYKALAIVPERGGKLRPAGFGADVG